MDVRRLDIDSLTLGYDKRLWLGLGLDLRLLHHSSLLVLKIGGIVVAVPLLRKLIRHEDCLDVRLANISALHHGILRNVVNHCLVLTVDLLGQVSIIERNS